MKTTLIFISFLLLASLNLFAEEEKEDGIYATLQTTKGDVVFRLFHKEKPLNVANFIALSQGQLKRQVPELFQKSNFYDGIKVHHVLKDYAVIFDSHTWEHDDMSLGYYLPLEENDSLDYMSNVLCLTSISGYNDGSQLIFSYKTIPFFQATNPIGAVVGGEDVIQSLKKGDSVLSIRIRSVGKEAKRFKATKIIDEQLEKQYLAELNYIANEAQRARSDLEALKSHDDEVYRYFAERMMYVWDNGKELPSGVKLLKTKTTDGNIPQNGQHFWVNYIGYLPDGTVFDSSYDNSEAARFTLGSEKHIAAWNEVFKQMRLGEKATIIVPSSSAYGAEGAGQYIPPYSTVLFDLFLDEIEEGEY